MKEERYEVVYQRQAAGITDVRIFTTLKELSEWLTRQNQPPYDGAVITDIRPFS